MLEKLTQFYNALKAIAIALGLVSIKCNEIASKINAIQTSFNMGKKTVAIKQNAIIFGVTITENEQDPEKRVTYIDDAKGRIPVKTNTSDSDTTNYNTWNSSWIFDRVYPAMIKTNGKIDYKLNPDDQTKKAAGGSSDIASTSYGGNALVVVEKFYIKYSMNGNNEEIRISNVKLDGYEPIGFIRSDGSEADYFCMPMFMGSFDSGSKLRSLSGQDIKYDISFTDFRTAAQKNGSSYDIETWAMNQAFQTFFYILLKSCNPKTALGYGRAYNDTNNKKTGVLVNKGGIAFDFTTKATKFLWVEDYTSDHSYGMYRWEAGILSQSNKIYVKMKPPYSEDSISEYTEVTDHVATQKNYTSAMKCSNKYGRYGVAYKGSESTYECSYWYTTNAIGIHVSLRAHIYGVSGRYLYNFASSSNYVIGAALSLLPTS